MSILLMYSHSKLYLPSSSFLPWAILIKDPCGLKHPAIVLATEKNPETS